MIKLLFRTLLGVLFIISFLDTLRKVSFVYLFFHIYCSGYEWVATLLTGTLAIWGCRLVWRSLREMGN